MFDSSATTGTADPGTVDPAAFASTADPAHTPSTASDADKAVTAGASAVPTAAPAAAAATSFGDTAASDGRRRPAEMADAAWQLWSRRVPRRSKSCDSSTVASEANRTLNEIRARYLGEM